MKMNPDCIRDILIYAEEKITYKEVMGKVVCIPVTLQELQREEGLLKRYNKTEIMYSVMKLIEGNHVKATNITPRNPVGSIDDCRIVEITYDGHEFLNNIRSNNVWNVVKDKMKKASIMSISALASVSGEVVKTIATDPQVIQEIVKMITP